MLKNSGAKKPAVQITETAGMCFNSINSWLMHNSQLNLHLGFHNL